MCQKLFGPIKSGNFWSNFSNLWSNERSKIGLQFPSQVRLMLILVIARYSKYQFLFSILSFRDQIHYDVVSFLVLFTCFCCEFSATIRHFESFWWISENRMIRQLRPRALWKRQAQESEDCLPSVVLCSLWCASFDLDTSSRGLACYNWCGIAVHRIYMDKAFHLKHCKNKLLIENPKLRNLTRRNQQIVHVLP